jgi:TPR repeat protein
MIWLSYICLILLVARTVKGTGSLSDFNNPALQFELGRAHGLNSTAILPHDMLQRIQSGAELGNRDNIYFLGLLKMYGISLQVSARGALENFRKAANLGLPEAMTAFGMCAYSGIGMDKDDIVAISWFRKAANAQDVNGYWLLAKMLMEGEGVATPNHPEAAVYFQMAADQQIPQAEHHLAIMFEYGLGVEQSFQRAAEYYQRAAEKSFTEAMYHLGLMYAHGRVGFPQDFKRAFPLFEAAATNGHAPSTYSIGILKMYGYGMEPNYDHAINWFERAAVMGDPRVSEMAKNSAREIRTLIQESMEVNEAILDAYARMADVSEEDDEDFLNSEDEVKANSGWFQEMGSSLD